MAIKRKWKILLGVVLLVIAAIAFVIVKQTSSPPFEAYASLTLPSSNGQDKILRAQFFGTTTILISDGDTKLMTDGYFSRPSLFDLLTSSVAPDQARIANVLFRGHIDKVDLLMVAHSHIDHALDSALVANKTGAILAGSESTANIARGESFSEDRFRVVKKGDSIDVGKFQVVFYETPHSLDAKFPGDIEQPLHSPAKISDYKLGKNYTFLIRHPTSNILIVPSANFVPDLFNDVKADTVFLGIGGLGKQPADFTRTYWNEVVRKTGAKLVIPIHWDNFGRSLDEPLVPLPYFMDDLSRSMDLLQELANTDGVSIRFAPLVEPFELPMKVNT